MTSILRAMASNLTIELYTIEDSIFRTFFLFLVLVSNSDDLQPGSDGRLQIIVMASNLK